MDVICEVLILIFIARGAFEGGDPVNETISLGAQRTLASHNDTG